MSRRVEEHRLSRAAPPPVGTTAWEHAGGPGLTLGQQLELLGGAAGLVSSHLAGKLRWWLTRRAAPKVDLSKWTPPDSRAAREAERRAAELCSPPMAGHSHRTYWFSAALCELAGAGARTDREALYVGAVMHDVGLFLPPVEGEHCFSVSSAREARRLATDAGWDAARQDKMALTITSNLNPRVPEAVFGAEAHFIALGGRVEVLAQQWCLHPENLAEILARHPRTGYHADAYAHVNEEAHRHPRCRFACLNPLFALLVKSSRFDGER